MCVVHLLQVDGALAAAKSSYRADTAGGLDAGSLTGGLGHAAAGETPGATLQVTCFSSGF